MIDFSRVVLKNGLIVVIHTTKTTPFVAFNLTYKVGSKDENEAKTGFAHLFEHLMFEGSKNIPNYDAPLQQIGGENNAFTSSDITNYYLTVPKENIETAFWLESDRMFQLAFSEESLKVQKGVVIEEFKQRYLNQPYGDVYLLLRPLVYKKHSYRWATIGKEIDHIENASLRDVEDFFYNFYAPNNAVLSVAGDISVEEVEQLAIKWFGDINKRKVNRPEIVPEPIQLESRIETVYRNVPVNAIYIAFKMPSRLEKEYYVADLITDILSKGESSRFYRKLVVEKQLFSDLQAYITGEHDEGMFVVSGKLSDGVTQEEAKANIWEELFLLHKFLVEEEELEKVKNKLISSNEFAKTSILNIAMALGIAETLSSANLVNTELSIYDKITATDIQNLAQKMLVEEKSNTLNYLKENGVK